MKNIFRWDILPRSLLFCFLIFFTTELRGAIIIVGPPPASIQTAIDGASNGDIIQLSAGTYSEEIHIISKSLDILGQGQEITTIQSPSSATHLTQNFSYGGVNWWCVVMVDNQAAPTAQTVNMSDLTVDGSNQQDTLLSPTYGTTDQFFAIGYHNANGTLQNILTTSTTQTSDFSELAGGGIVNASDSGTVNFTVGNSIIQTYQRVGIDCRGAALNAVISNNTIVRGYVLPPNTSTATPYGIQFSETVRGSATSNSITGNIATVANDPGIGILLSGVGANFLVSGNNMKNNDIGIVADLCGDGLAIGNNQISFVTTPAVNPVKGMVIQNTNGSSFLSSNVMNSLFDVNMELTSSTDQSFFLSNNRFLGSQVSLLITGATSTGPIVSMNGDSFKVTDGYFIQEVAAPHDVWPSTLNVLFDGIAAGYLTLPEFNLLLTKIYDQHNDPTLGLVVDFVGLSSKMR